MLSENNMFQCDCFHHKSWTVQKTKTSLVAGFDKWLGILLNIPSAACFSSTPLLVGVENIRYNFFPVVFCCYRGEGHVYTCVLKEEIVFLRGDGFY